jgi:sec-independent protein translocase protein TatA
MFNIGPLELMVVLVVALLVVGPKRLPEVGRSIGRGLREFRRAQEEVRRTISFDLDEPAPVTGSAGQTRPPTPEPPSAQGEGQAAQDPKSATSSAAEIAGALGQGVAELRRVREEIRRSFQVDLDDEPPTGPSVVPQKRTSPDPEAEPADPPPIPPGGTG